MSTNELYTSSQDGENLIIHLGEEVVGGSSALEFQNHLNEALDSIKLVIIDLSKVDKINSSGLGMLVAAHTTVNKVDKNLVLCSVPDKVLNLITMTHLDKVLTIVDNLETALK